MEMERYNQRLAGRAFGCEASKNSRYKKAPAISDAKAPISKATLQGNAQVMMQSGAKKPPA